MLTQEGLKALLGIPAVTERAPVTIYSETYSERLKYSCEFIFTHVLKFGCRIVNNPSDFETAEGAKINYSTRVFQGAIQILPAGLLEEKGISRLRPVPVLKDGMLYLYETNKAFHFDLFSAVFYMISRYEEWQGYSPDRHGRFEAAESILYSRSFHLKPVVDHWIMELETLLYSSFPGLKRSARQFQAISTIDVDNLYAYKSKGITRTLGASAKDLAKMDLTNLRNRLLVISGRKKDPFDIYEEVSAFCFENKVPLIYFFLLRTGTRHDRTVQPSGGAFKKVFPVILENKAMIGLHPSYDSAYKNELLEKEIGLLNEQVGQKVYISRQHYLRFDITSTPALLLSNGINCDFSMGFASVCGFRAGTSFPFYYYDFKAEKATPLLFVPFCAMDGVFTVYNPIEAEKAYEDFMSIAAEVKKVKGVYITVFHERSFSDHLYPGYGTLYKKLIANTKV